jgi:hypothetical protein
MTDDPIPWTLAEPEAMVIVRRIKARRHRHRWDGPHVVTEDSVGIDGIGLRSYLPTCACGTVKDAAASRRGKSARRLGNDGERRSEKRYGWRKVGEFGGIDDLLGKLFIVQQKTTRTAAPLRWTRIFAGLDGRAGGRVPAILLSYVHQGRDTEDFILVRGRDWLDLHGRDESE